MEHQSLYRKYRSQSFEEVVGQTHVTRTLQNALTSDRVAHAYLFCGPRGTGKTSTARLLAKALNCDRGPTPTPCNECDMCLGITAGRAMDVVEVDAASETGIDNVREVIINNSRYAPAQGRYKIYIIDEVHDLSRPAFDGLLKTLEEPPPHVVFILATTEIHKVPATIISRCQRFEFRRGSLEEVRSRVEYVARAEGVDLDPIAANLIARSASGGWRDALSLLEQVISFSDKQITARDVGLVLGTIEDESLANLARLALSGDGLGALRALDSLLSEGKDLRQLLHNFADYLRDCLVHALGAPDDGSRSLVKLPPAQGMRLLEETARTERELRWNTQHRLVMELMLLRMTAPAAAAVQAATVSPSSAHPHVSAAPVAASSVVESPTVRRPSARPAAETPVAARATPEPDRSASPMGPIGYRPAPMGPSATGPSATGPSATGPSATGPEGPAGDSRAADPFADTSPNAPAAAAAPASNGLAAAGGSPESPGASPFDSSGPAAAAEEGDPGPTDGVGGAAAATILYGGSQLDITAIHAQWRTLLSRITANSKTLAAKVRSATLVDFVGDLLTLEFKQRFHYQGVEEATARRVVEGILSDLVGQPVRIACRLSAEGEAPPRARAPRKEVQPVTEAELIQLFPNWEIREG